MLSSTHWIFCCNTSPFLLLRCAVLNTCRFQRADIKICSEVVTSLLRKLVGSSVGGGIIQGSERGNSPPAQVASQRGALQLKRFPSKHCYHIMLAHERAIVCFDAPDCHEQLPRNTMICCNSLHRNPVVPKLLHANSYPLPKSHPRDVLLHALLLLFCEENGLASHIWLDVCPKGWLFLEKTVGTGLRITAHLLPLERMQLQAVYLIGLRLLMQGPSVLLCSTWVKEWGHLQKPVHRILLQEPETLRIHSLHRI